MTALHTSEHDAASLQPLAIDAAALVQGPSLDATKGVWVYQVASPYLGGVNPVEVLLPDDWAPGRTYRMLYVLPVHPGIGGRWGDGLQVVRALNAHNSHQLICVTPAFDTWPYYGAHASDSRIRHEAYILRVLLPLIESRYAGSGRRQDRLLLGFSKSGWGAFLLTLRNPEVFGFACSWDAPMMMTERNFGLYETAEHFGTRECMAQFVPRAWAKTTAHHFRDECRLVLLGHNFFGTRWWHDLPHTMCFHWLLKRLGIVHEYDNAIKVPHTWNAQWMGPAIERLMTVVVRQDARSARAAGNDEHPVRNV